MINNVINQYMAWKNRYDHIRDSEFIERDRRLYSRTFEKALCQTLQEEHYDSEIIELAGNLGRRIIGNAKDKIINGTKEEALVAIEDGLKEYEFFIRRYFPDAVSKLNEIKGGAK
jgi:hypothetical protein